MLILNPTSVTLGSQILPNVSAIAIDRVATRQIIEWSDAGPHIVYVDCPEQRITITLIQEFAQGDLSSPPPGASLTLNFHTSIDASHAGWSKITVPTVLLATKHESKTRGFTRTLTFAAISTDGSTDPVTVAPLP